MVKSVLEIAAGAAGTAGAGGVWGAANRSCQNVLESPQQIDNVPGSQDSEAVQTHWFD
jgi:hypothetical protein